jgi:hypothetical protein
MSRIILNADQCGVEVNSIVEYPAMQSAAVAECYVGFILTLKGQAFSLNLCNHSHDHQP